MRSFFILLAVAGSFSAHSQVTYKDVAPVFYSRCTGCHHEGAHHFPFMNYTQTAGMAFSIQTALLNNRMPPWKADTSYTRFQHERIITASEKQLIIDWVNGGTLKGDTTLAPPAPVYNSAYQLAGEADLTLSIGKFTSRSLTHDEYHCFSIPTNLTTDRIIRAFEVVPGNKEIVHHAVITIDSTGTYQTDTSGMCYNIPGNVGLGSYAPGTRATVFPGEAPVKSGIYLKAGSRIIFQVHYPAGSKGKVDSTKIRLYFYPEGSAGIRRIYSATPLQNWNMAIPANTVTAFEAFFPSPNIPLPFSVSVYGVMPHSHLLCTSIVNYAFNNSGDTIPLIHIPQWDFEWQDYYTFRKLVKIPAGYKVYAKHWYDNTSNNINNPNNPPKMVFAGTDTGDEMLFDGALYLMYVPGDELVDIEAMIRRDPILSIKEHYNRNVRVLAYPNPYTDRLNLDFNLDRSTDVSVQLFSLQGQLLAEENLGKLRSGSHSWKMDSKHLQGKAVFYRLVTGEGSQAGIVLKAD